MAHLETAGADRGETLFFFFFLFLFFFPTLSSLLYIAWDRWGSPYIWCTGILSFVSCLWTSCILTVQMWTQSQCTPYPYHLARPLRFALSHLGVGCPDSCCDRVLGWSVRTTWPSKRRFFRGTLQTEESWQLPALWIYYGNFSYNKHITTVPKYRII